jgi:hypothetical protein
MRKVITTEMDHFNSIFFQKTGLVNKQHTYQSILIVFSHELGPFVFLF